jgi:hypothetical protein
MTTLTKFISNTSSSITNATFRAMNKTSSKLNTRFKKTISSETGLSSKLLSKRFRIRKATKTSFRAGVGFGTKYGIALNNFKPKIKILKKGKRKYKGVTVKIGKAAREIVPGAFLNTVKSGKSLVLARTSARRYPIKSVKYEGVYAIAKANQPSLKEYAQTEYKILFDKQLKFELSKQK